MPVDFLDFSFHLFVQKFNKFQIAIPNTLNLFIHKRFNVLFDLCRIVNLCESVPFIGKYNSTFLTVILVSIFPNKFRLFVIMNMTN